MLNDTFMAHGLLHDMFSPDSLHTECLIEGAAPSHLETRSDTIITDTNMTTKDFTYLCLDQDDRR